MSSPSKDVRDAVARVLRGAGTSDPNGTAGWAVRASVDLDSAGFADVLVSRSADVVAAGADLWALAEAVGSAGASVPVVETAVVRRAQSALGSAEADAIGAVARVPTGAGRDRVRGVLRHVVWAPVAEHLVLLGDDGAVGIVALDECRLATSTTLADEPVADVTMPEQGVELTANDPYLSALLSLGQTARILGAARAVLDLSVRYARDRHQFGKPIMSFQAVSHQLAHLGGAVEMLDAMLEHAAAGLDSAEYRLPSACAARLCAADASALAVQVGHQVHGAIGVTVEYALQGLTRRLLAWSTQCGSVELDAVALGRSVGGPDALWGLLTGTGPYDGARVAGSSR